jgi:hypothetical protein
MVAARGMIAENALEGSSLAIRLLDIKQLFDQRRRDVSNNAEADKFPSS